jgi:hypothetical protein
MKLYLFLTLLAFSSCLSQNSKIGSQNNVSSSDSVYINKGYLKYQSKYHYSFFYSKNWLIIPNSIFKKEVENSYSKPDPKIDTEAGFSLNSENEATIFPRFHIETFLEKPPTLAILKQQISIYLDSSYMASIINDYSSQLAEKLSILSFNHPTIDENNKIIYLSTFLNLKGTGKLYSLSVTYLGLEVMVSFKIFLPSDDKDKYLKEIYNMIASFKFDEGYKYK